MKVNCIICKKIIDTNLIDKEKGAYLLEGKMYCYSCLNIPKLRDCNNCKFIKTCESGIYINKEKNYWLRQIIGIYCNEFKPKPKVLDDWYWFLKSYWMILFNPLAYAKEIYKIRGFF